MSATALSIAPKGMKGSVMISKDQRITQEELDLFDDEHDGRIIHAWQNALPRRKPTPEGALEWECVFRVPTRRELQMFLQQIDSGSSLATRAMAPEGLARACVVHVSGGTKNDARIDFDALLEKYPGIPQRVATDLAKLAGFDAGEIEKK